jgi:hypothetical protein
MRDNPIYAKYLTRIKVGEARTISELFDALDMRRVLPGSDKSYSADELEGLIKRFLRALADVVQTKDFSLCSGAEQEIAMILQSPEITKFLKTITRTDGLRAGVQRLASNLIVKELKRGA